MTDARIKAEQLAAEARESSDHWLTTEAAKDATEPQAYRDGYLTARTITAEQVEEAAKEVWRHQVGADASGFYKHTYAHTATKCMDTARAAFRAAGFTVGGGE